MTERGAPTKFKEEYIEQAEKLAKYGLIDKEIAEFFGVTEKTLNNWKQAHPDFLQSLKKGKEISDSEVIRSLYDRATGYSHPEDKIFNHNGKEMVVPTTKHYPPDTTACIFWLKNRIPEDWREKPTPDDEDDEVTPVRVEINVIDASKNA